ncbi:hypothetical protein MLD38_005646 [Melastoma candidum]|uniref:Uncharacterized protein n=1 Tax=Melastoma candidum TaxID=119954 RepID=A0ACB9RJX3_9MYRT|nr:hypothetical protein MLD38_005646 [Melastoma candidum]
MAVEKEMLSTLAGSGTEEVVAAEASDLNSSVLTPQSDKRPRYRTKAISLAQKYKGVVQQQNGHWGAQIYANHQRIWLGTFKSDKEAAMAYDSAAIKLRSGDSHRNIPQNQKSCEEHEFQSCHTTEAVLAMIKDGTYRAKLSEYLSARSFHQQKPENDLAFPSLIVMRNPDSFSYRQLFQKELTPSDVGKLNRLVIPKKFATRFFPRVMERAAAGTGVGPEDMQLVFYDRGMRSWNFRYCYWSSSHSFVFTRGWNRFVKDKGLNAGDIVCFYECVYRDQGSEGRTFCMVDVIKRETGSIPLDLGSVKGEVDEDTGDNPGIVDEEMDSAAKKNELEHGVFRLFGVDIK